MDSELEASWRQLAADIWRKPTSRTRKVHPDTVKESIWNPLEKINFPPSALAYLESLGLLEDYLWPGFDEDASNQHVLLIAMLTTAKKRQGLSVWYSESGFPSLFRRLLALSVDKSSSIILQTFLLEFFITAFQSLDNALVRKQCAPLVSIPIWKHLNSDAVLEAKLSEQASLRKAWRASTRRFDAADDETKAHVEFERNWLYTMVLDFCRYLWSPASSATTLYCEKFVEFLIDLESQLPTRRYVNTLLQDLNVLTVIRLSPTHRQDDCLMHDLFQLLRHYVFFAINDHSGAPLSEHDAHEAHAARLTRLQRVALKNFREKLTLLALSNHSALEQRGELTSQLVNLTDEEIRALVATLGLRSTYPIDEVLVDRNFLIEIIISNFQRHPTYQETVRGLSSVPTEHDLYSASLSRNEAYDGTHSVALPKLNLQYLSLGDFLWRSFILFRCEAFFEVRTALEEVIRRMEPRWNPATQKVHYGGQSKLALPINKPAILEVAPPKVGMISPAFVRAEITLDPARLPERIWREWESLRPGDVLYLLAVKPNDHLTNGEPHSNHLERAFRYLRTAELIQILHDNNSGNRDRSSKSRVKRLIVHLDPDAYHKDLDRDRGKQDVYDALNVLVRRNRRENNSKWILESIKSLVLSHTPLPKWLQDVFLGFGDPAAATYPNIPNKLHKVDYRDTFLDWSHLQESLPQKIAPTDQEIEPPYVLEVVEDAQKEPPTKRRKQESNKPKAEVLNVSTYKPPNTGPYAEDIPLSNQVRFTPTQIQAIISGTQPGLTIIVGPPGTGKTDVATQIINNIYHDFPDQRTLLIAHSNQALNQLFQKITKLDIDERHLLRLGHGEEELDTAVNYGKSGRVESFLDNRGRLLAEVDRLAANLGAPGAHGQSCETAGYFQSVYITPAWTNFWLDVSKSQDKALTIRTKFPFYQYFSNAKPDLLPESESESELLEIVQGCQRHIEKIFSELEDIRPFEIVRSAKDRSNYLLIKEARIIAMTATYAAIRRQEIVNTGFHYDNVVMEEAAQVTEFENFIPLTLQHTSNGALPLKRIVLCGDHHQNAPIISNLAFRQFANLEQSMFQRLVRLGVPVINLDQQGRSRPSIAELYRWRYSNLGDLPAVVDGPEFKLANAGFRYDYQFIDVGDYKGVGERQPTPHFIQNLGEAEYTVALYQYMRLLGYPASKITILTTYAGQRALIADVLNHRCRGNRLFGLPKYVNTVDKYQGEQNDYIILSLVRTSRVGYLRDVRRLTVALSRARLGLYILGRKDLFEMCLELEPAFKVLLQWPTSLMVVPGEVFPTTRASDAEVDATVITGVEHLGQYVYEMTQAKIAQLKSGAVVESAEEVANDEINGEDNDIQEEEEGDGDPV